MVSESRARRRPLTLVFGLVWLALAAWNASDGASYWWQVAMGVFFIGQYVFADSDVYAYVSGAVGGLVLALMPDVWPWLRVVGALIAVVGLFLMARATVRFARSRQERSREPSTLTLSSSAAGTDGHRGSSGS
jgi:hypothetical protein